MNEAGNTALPTTRHIVLGEIVGTHGVKGLLRFHPYSGSFETLTPPQTVFLTPRKRSDAAAPQPSAAHVLASARPHGRVLLLEFEDVTSIDAAEPLIGTTLSVAETALPPPGPGEIYVYRLEGLEVVTVGGDRLGTIASVFPTGSNEVLVVRDGNREHLIPVIADVIRSIDLEGGRVVIEPIAGLLE